MTKLRLLPTVVEGTRERMQSGTALAQDDSTAPDPAADASMAAEDPRFAELETLMPPALAGLPLGDNLVFATGEELLDIMQPEESAILEEVLEANGKTAADYAAATSWLPTSESDIVVVQAHRIAGVAASETIEAWVEIVSVNLEDPPVGRGLHRRTPGDARVRRLQPGGADAAPVLCRRRHVDDRRCRPSHRRRGHECGRCRRRRGSRARGLTAATLGARTSGVGAFATLGRR